MAEARRRAMGSDAHLVIVTDGNGAEAEALLAAGWARIEELEDRWSRFRPDSEVSVLNRRAGVPVVVSGETFHLVHCGLVAWELTAGRFDPTVGAALVRHGYDRDFEAVAARGMAAPGRAAPAPGPAGVELDPQSSAVMLPVGVTFDPGGIGKGLGADLVAAALIDAGAAGALVNLGGDLRAVGAPPTAAGWVISVADPLDHRHRELARIALAHGAVATTSRLRRQWSTPTGTAHHLIDPATGRPAETDVVAVTIVAGEAWRAEALTKLVFLSGPGELARCRDVHGLVVTADGQHHATPGIAGALR